jgi:eukaryotic-like serine/threonine-protein kinase
VVEPLRGAYAMTRALLLALRLGEPARVARSLAFDAAYLAAFGKGRRALAVARLAEAEAEHAGDVEAQVVVLGAKACAHLFGSSGWRDALACAVEVEQRSRELQEAGWETDTAQIYACFSLLYLGELGELSRRVAAHIAEARRRGDRYQEVGFRTRLGIIWLAADDPERAEREAITAIESWFPAARSYQVQHCWALAGICEARLYRGDAEAAAAELESQWRALAGSHLLWVPILRIEMAYLAGRIAGARADRAGVRRAVRRLERVGWPISRAFAQLLRAGAAGPAGAVAHLHDAIAALDGIDSQLHACAARRRLGECLGGDPGAELIAAADAWMAGQGIRSPERMTALLVPWPAGAGHDS